VESVKPVFDPSFADVRESLPAIGGAVGGIVGGGTGLATTGIGVVPGAVGGATAGQASGEVLRQMIRRAQGMDVDRSLSDRAWDVAKEGAVGGGTEITGGVANRAAVGAGHRGLTKVASGTAPVPS
jgi:hypothetical protein